MTQARKTNRGPSAGPENRAALIAAARTVFEERGIDAPLSSVAKLAGVGQGSLYRHFPDRISLALAVFDENLTELEALAARPETTLRDVADLVTYQAEGAAAFIDLIAVNRADARIATLGGRLRAVVESTWDAARAEGFVGEHATVDDFLMAVSMVAAVVASAPASERHSTAESAWALLSPGLER